MVYGYRDKTLHVDSSNRKTEVDEKGDTFYRSCLGGRRIGYHYPLKRETKGC